MTTPIHLAISTCPNDTFAFHALIEGLVDHRGLDFHVELLDIQQLNERLFAGDFDVAKASFHAALLLADSTVVMPSGSALGFGVGPLLLAAKAEERPSGDADGKRKTVLCPGQHTTAALLFRLFYPESCVMEHTIFSDIMPALQSGAADFGVCIHEGRFTWQEQGLSLVEDLGTRWETETQSPLPLGGILGRRAVPYGTLATVQAVINDSLQYALNDREAALPTMRRHAQEFDDTVLMQHVDLYVNDWTVDLGETGRSALTELSLRAADIGVISKSAAMLDVFSVD